MPIILNEQLVELAKKCSPTVAPTTMVTLVQTESRRNSLAIGVNGYKLKSQPKSESQAIAWVKYLDKNNYNFDIGLTQVNIVNVRKYKLSPEKLLDPCTNLRIGGDILTKNYINARKTTKDPQVALRKALSAYNTGNQSSGYKNGYLIKMLNNLKTQ